MKKILVALAAAAALASCAKSEVEFTSEQQEIAITPVTENRTKAMVTGTEFPNEQFNVWAFYKQIGAGTSIEKWQASPADQTKYIDEKPFAQKGDSKLWGGVKSYFWPKLGSLMFVGYYPTSMDEKVSYTFTADVNMMNVEGYSPTTDKYASDGFVTANTTCTEDFMYFKMTANSCDANTTGPLNSVTEGKHIDVLFKHALSWLVVTLDRDDANTPDDAKIVVTNVSFTNVTTTGDAVIDNGDADAEIAWTPKKGTDNANVTDISILGTTDGTKELKKGEDPYTCLQPILIPQTMEGNLVITYRIISEDDSYFEETKTIPVSDLHGTNAEGEVDNFLPAKRYIYNILIGTSEILIDPYVQAWDDEKVSL